MDWEILFSNAVDLSDETVAGQSRIICFISLLIARIVEMRLVGKMTLGEIKNNLGQVKKN